MKGSDYLSGTKRRQREHGSDPLQLCAFTVISPVILCISDTRHLRYLHAFVVLSLSHVYIVCGQVGYRARAWSCIQAASDVVVELLVF